MYCVQGAVQRRAHEFGGAGGRGPGHFAAGEWACGQGGGGQGAVHRPCGAVPLESFAASTTHGLCWVNILAARLAASAGLRPWLRPDLWAGAPPRSGWTSCSARCRAGAAPDRGTAPQACLLPAAGCTCCPRCATTTASPPPSSCPAWRRCTARRRTSTSPTWWGTRAPARCCRRSRRAAGPASSARASVSSPPWRGCLRCPSPSQRRGWRRGRVSREGRAGAGAGEPAASVLLPWQARRRLRLTLPTCCASPSPHRLRSGVRGPAV
jgi:hypothetical protein